ncbi:2-phospho-L-lactate transferase [soil metagenome]
MKITALAGGVGGAKLLVGLQKLAGSDLTAIVNTGDDAELYGVHVSPDLDIVTYWLAGIADYERGWGIEEDTFHLVDALEQLGEQAWFRLGDRDFATCLARTRRLRAGMRLSEVSGELARGLGVAARVLPMSDDPVRTMVETSDGRRLEFQEYFVKERHRPEIVEVSFDGLDDAKPAPGVLDALADADIVILCPSNPFLSIGPIVSLAGVKETLAAHPRVIAVSPIVRGAALKGPADRLLESLGAGAGASAVARLYAGFCDAFVVDVSDPEERALIQELGMRAVALPSIMRDHNASERLASSLLEL